MSAQKVCDRTVPVAWLLRNGEIALLFERRWIKLGDDFFIGPGNPAIEFAIGVIVESTPTSTGAGHDEESQRWL